MRLRALALAAGSLASLAVAQVLAGPPPALSSATPTGSDDWPAYAHDLRSTKYFPLALIDKESFRNLRLVWRWSSPDNDIIQKNPSLHLNLFEGTPLMVDGQLYVSGSASGGRDRRGIGTNPLDVRSGRLQARRPKAPGLRAPR